jgi:Tfp pilus assembly protein FimT
VLFIVLAVPAISAITGTRSVAAAENNLSALLARAREEAVGVQEIRGVMFYIDPATDGVVGIIVRADSQNANGVWLLDAVPGRDSLALPRGIRLQTMYDGRRNGNNEHYLGYNPLTGTATDPAYPSAVKDGGVILFDQHGRLVVVPYGFLFAKSGFPQSALAEIFHLASPTANSFVLNPAPFSQMGAVLFDKKIFVDKGFVDDDAYLGGTGDEAGKEQWLDANGTAVLVNRYTGTLIRGE